MNLPHIPSFRLDGERALATGAPCGIGLWPLVLLASEASAMMTGTHLIVDGGWTAE